MKKISLFLLIVLATSLNASPVTQFYSGKEVWKKVSQVSNFESEVIMMKTELDNFTYLECYTPNKIFEISYSADTIYLTIFTYSDSIEYQNTRAYHKKWQNSSAPIQLAKDVAEYFFDKESEQDKNFTHVEQMPQFPGGDIEFLNWVQKNLKYPDSAQGISGKVILKFVVTEFGDIERIEVIQSLTPDCDRAAINLMKSSPKWKPGQVEGRPVSCYYTLPITFKRNDAEKQTKKNEKKTWNF